MIAEPTVLSKEEVPALKWMPADEDGLVKFLVQDRNFNEERIRNAVKKINSHRGSSNQGMDVSPHGGQWGGERGVAFQY